MSMSSTSTARKTACGIVAAGLAASMGVGAFALPARAFADTTSSTAIKLSVSEAGITTATDDAGNAGNVTVVIPVQMEFVANVDGTFSAKQGSTVAFRNNSGIPLHVSKIKAAGDGVDIVADEGFDKTKADQVSLTFKPGSGQADELANYTGAGAAPEVPADWNILANSSLALNDLAGQYGRLSGVASSEAATIGTIEWTIAVGKVS